MPPTFDLASARLNKGLTQRDLAELAGVSYQTIQRLESGLTARPANAKKVADFFNVQVTDLMPIDPDRAAA